MDIGATFLRALRELLRGNQPWFLADGISSHDSKLMQSAIVESHGDWLVDWMPRRLIQSAASGRQ